jgi:hypothetical protein
MEGSSMSNLEKPGESWDDRHPSTQHMIKMLRPNPNLPEGLPKETSEVFFGIALDAIDALKDSPELTEGLRKLWEAKNSFVAAAVLFND